MLLTGTCLLLARRLSQSLNESHPLSLASCFEMRRHISIGIPTICYQPSGDAAKLFSPEPDHYAWILASPGIRKLLSSKGTLPQV